ncbi:MAG: M20/M25/M40 family metallo-hydrolase [Spirochaetota bacterium]
MNLYELLQHISVPRPNHSDSLAKIAKYLQDTLAQHDIPFAIQNVLIYPYKMLIVGLICFIFALIFAWCVKKQKSIGALLSLLAIPLILIFEFELVTPIVSWIIPKESANIIVNFNNPEATRTLILIAHYDSKTDIFDHIQRAKIYQFIVSSIAIGLLVVLIMALSKKFSQLLKPVIKRAVLVLVLLFVFEWLMVAIAMGGFIFVKQQSYGSIDNASSVAALMGLAHNIQQKKVFNKSLNIAIVFTTAEEINMQGAKYYVNDLVKRKKGQNFYAINVELAGEPGNMVYYTKSGVMLGWYPADSHLAKKISDACYNVSKRHIQAMPKITDDSIMFAKAGIPVVTIGFANEAYSVSGLHSTRDNLQRVSMENIYTMIKTLGAVIQNF